jgi:hypothetical protein
VLKVAGDVVLFRGRLGQAEVFPDEEQEVSEVGPDRVLVDENGAG